MISSYYMELKLVKKVNATKDTVSFFFQSNERFEFISGQYIYITLPKLNYEDERGATRHFTISNSPTEKEFIVITTRIREESGYKKTLNELNIGDFVEGRGPLGSFIFNEKDNTKSHVFLAGGIGITPFRSMIKYCYDKRINTNILLIYSNSTNDFVFKSELDEIQKNYGNLKIEYINTQEQGRLDKNKLELLLNNNRFDKNNSEFMIVGPNPFVDGMEEILEVMKINEDNIKTEKFTGY